MYHVMIGSEVLTGCSLYLISVDIVGCCNRLIMSFNGGFFTISEVIGIDGERISDFSFESDDSSVSTGGFSFSSSSSTSSSSFESQKSLSSSLNNG